MLTQDVVPVGDGVRVTVDITEVGILRCDAQRHPFAAAADHDWRTRLLHGHGIVIRLVDAVVLAAKAGRALGQHALDDLDSLLEHFHPVANGWKWPTIGSKLRLVPRCPESNNGAAVGHDVERCQHLRQKCRIAIWDTNDQLSDPNTCGPGRDAAESDETVEDRLFSIELVVIREHEVVGKPHGVDACFFRRDLFCMARTKHGKIIFKG